MMWFWVSRTEDSKFTLRFVYQASSVVSVVQPPEID